MLYLYHGTTSVCAIKVRLTIAEKALPWEGEVLWLQRGDQYRPDYLKLNPNAVVPTLVHDGKVIIESTLIMEYLDENFPDIPLAVDNCRFGTAGSSPLAPHAPSKAWGLFLLYLCARRDRVLSTPF
jgi:glutathione S-transferase